MANAAAVAETEHDMVPPRAEKPAAIYCLFRKGPAGSTSIDCAHFIWPASADVDRAQ